MRLGGLDQAREAALERGWGLADIVSGLLEHEHIAVVNKVRSILPCIAVKAPGYGDRRRAILDDIAVLTGGHVISPEAGMSLEHMKLEDLGHARTLQTFTAGRTVSGG